MNSTALRPRWRAAPISSARGSSASRGLYDLSDAGLANVPAHVTNTALHFDHPTLEVSEVRLRRTSDTFGRSAPIRAHEADRRDIRAVREATRTRQGGRGHALADGLFERQARAAPRRAFGFRLVALDASSSGSSAVADRDPTCPASRLALVQRVNSALLNTIFEISCGYAFDDAIPADKIAAFAKDGSALAQREAEHEVANRGLFEPLTRAG